MSPLSQRTVPARGRHRSCKTWFPSNTSANQAATEPVSCRRSRPEAGAAADGEYESLLRLKLTSFLPFKPSETAKSMCTRTEIMNVSNAKTVMADAIDPPPLSHQFRRIILRNGTFDANSEERCAGYVQDRRKGQIRQTIHEHQKHGVRKRTLSLHESKLEPTLTVEEETRPQSMSYSNETVG